MREKRALQRCRHSQLKNARLSSDPILANLTTIKPRPEGIFSGCKAIAAEMDRFRSIINSLGVPVFVKFI